MRRALCSPLRNALPFKALLSLALAVLVFPSPASANSYNNYNRYGSSTSGSTTKYQQAVVVGGETCFTQPLSFSKKRFDYALAVAPGTALPPGCASTDILVSKLYVSGTCIQERDLEDTGCPSSVDNGTTVDAGSNASGYVSATNDTSSQCNLVFSSSPANYEPLATGRGQAIDSGYDVCAPSSDAYYYIQNNCAAATGAANLTLTVEVYAYSYSCDSSSDWVPSWLYITIVAVGVVGFTFCAVFGWRKRRKMQTGQVQMSTPVGSVPPPAYGNGQGTYYPGGYQQQPYPTPTPAYSASVPGYPAPAGEAALEPVPSQPQPQQSGPIWHAGSGPVTGYPKI